jgi:hypothetical protein
VPTAERFHAFLLPSEDNPSVLAEGPVKPGPCSRPIENCVTFEATGSFSVNVHLVGVPVDVAPTLAIPVVGPTGGSLGTRSLVCPPADSTGRSACTGFVEGAGVLPQLGGLVVLTGPLPTPTATTTTAPNNVTQIAAGLAPDGVPGVPCAIALGAECQVIPISANGPSGTTTVTGSMSVSLTLPAGVAPPGAVANAFFTTTAGIENVACAPAVVGAAIRCVGNLLGNAIEQSTVRVFVGGVQVATGRVVGLRPLAVVPLLPPPPPQLLPPPPPPFAPPPLAVQPPVEVPVIPEAGPLALLATGLAALGALARLRRRP